MCIACGGGRVAAPTCIVGLRYDRGGCGVRARWRCALGQDHCVGLAWLFWCIHYFAVAYIAFPWQRLDICRWFMLPSCLSDGLSWVSRDGSCGFVAFASGHMGVIIVESARSRPKPVRPSLQKGGYGVSCKAPARPRCSRGLGVWRKGHHLWRRSHAVVGCPCFPPAWRMGSPSCGDLSRASLSDASGLLCNANSGSLLPMYLQHFLCLHRAPVG